MSQIPEHHRDRRLICANDLRTRRLAASSAKVAALRFLAPSDLGADVLRSLADDAIKIKTDSIDFRHSLTAKRIALLFQKTSTRTHCSFEAGIWDMSGFPSVIDWKSSNFLLSDLSDEI